MAGSLAIGEEGGGSGAEAAGDSPAGAVEERGAGSVGAVGKGGGAPSAASAWIAAKRVARQGVKIVLDQWEHLTFRRANRRRSSAV